MWLSGGAAKGFAINDKLKALLTDPRIIATKRLLGSHQERAWFKQKLSQEPVIHARAATKNEPGLKRRPLRAADDGSYMVAAFASNNMEKYLSIRGTVMRQTPADVQTTAMRLLNAKTRSANTILCVDFANFNNTHTTRSRAYANLAMQQAYDGAGHAEQATAAHWMARAQLNHWLGEQLSNQGLSSGERDTARDNTMLHAIYAELAYKHLEATGSPWQRPASIHMCGDDEIAVGYSWHDAMAYVSTLAMQGHEIQRRKLMVSSNAGEFLQYNMLADKPNIPMQPLAPALTNFVSGSWYKASAYNALDYPTQVSEAAASCCRRGASQHTMRKLAISTTHWLCKGLPWRTALSASNLFGAQCQQPEWIRNKPTLPKELAASLRPSAMQEYSEGLAKRMDLQPDEIRATIDYASSTIYASVCANLRVSDSIDKRQNMIIKDIDRINTHLPLHTMDGVARRWLQMHSAGRADSMTWTAVQLGIPLPLIERIGLEAIVARATNTMRQHVNSPHDYPQATITAEQLAQLPGALASYFKKYTIA
jgi:hypothetical protein